MIVRIDQNTNHSKREMYEFQKNASYESIVIVLNCDGTSSVWVQSLA